MIKRELAKDPQLATESWDRFLPGFRKRHLRTSEKTARKNERLHEKDEARQVAGLAPIAEANKDKPAKKVYTPFPPAQLPRKVRFCADPRAGSGVNKMNYRWICNWSRESIFSSLTRRWSAMRSERWRR